MTMNMGQAFGSMINNFNILGMGSDPIYMAFSLAIALAITRKEIQLGKYTNTIGVFAMAYASFFGAGVIYSTGLFMAILGMSCIGIIVQEMTRRYR